MDTVRRYENGQINYEPDEFKNIEFYCPICNDEVEIVEWEAVNINADEIDDNKYITIIGGYCDRCNSIINEELLNIKILKE